MLVSFLLQLTCGMVAALLLLAPSQVNPRFFRAHFLIALGFACTTGLFLGSAVGPVVLTALAVAGLGAFVGSMVWSLDGAPFGRTAMAVTAAAFTVALVWHELHPPIAADSPPASATWRLAAGLSASALLGLSFTAMLMGHSYLTAPAMSLTPLLRLLGALGASLLVRAGLAGVGLWDWSRGHSLTNLGDVAVLWLPVRWVLGLAGPLVLGSMAYQAARIRSTQSATGILYVVVVFCFLGELTSQLLLGSTGYLL